jgi:hypothetical protein
MMFEHVWPCAAERSASSVDQIDSATSMGRRLVADLVGLGLWHELAYEPCTLRGRA